MSALILPKKRQKYNTPLCLDDRMNNKKFFRGSNQPFSQRQLRVGEELRHVLSQLFLRGELSDPELSSVSITISEVRMSPDLINATVYVTQLGVTEPKKHIVEALNRAAPFLRHKIAQRIYLRRVPNLSFEYDTSFEYADRMSNLMKDMEQGISAGAVELERTRDSD